MKKITFLITVLVLCSSHDMFLKLDTYFLEPNTPSTIQLFNGTFEKSDNIITRDRMNDVSLVGHGVRSQVDTSQWSEKDMITVLNFTSGEAGTWVAGVSTNPRNIEMKAKAFNEYLEHDGVLDMLAWRKKNNMSDKDAIEKYSKHVKTIFQVGDTKTNDWQTVLGYPIEFVPLHNPYNLSKGDVSRVKLLRNGQALPNQIVFAGTGTTDHHHDHKHDHVHTDHQHDAAQLRTDSDGIVSVTIDDEGIWYLRTIHMEALEEEGLTHESNWATLTFEIAHTHAKTEGEHTHIGGIKHSHDNGDHHGVPLYVYILGGILIVAAMFWLLKPKK